MVDKISKGEDEIIDFDRNNDQKDNDPFIRDVARQQNEGESDNRLSSYFVKKSDDVSERSHIGNNEDNEHAPKRNLSSESSKNNGTYSREDFSISTINNDQASADLNNSNISNGQFEQEVKSSGRATGEISIDQKSNGSASINNYQTIDVESRNGFLSRSRSTDEVNDSDDEEQKSSQSNDEADDQSEDNVDQQPEKITQPEDNNTSLTEENNEPLVGESNAIPTSTDNKITFNEDGSYSFSVSDFSFNDVDDDGFDHITITELPENGSLTLNGELVSAGDNISADEISNLIFTPEANASGENYGDFKFTVNDGEDDSIEHNFNIDVSAVADAPTLVIGSVASISFITDFQDTNFSGSWGRIDANEIGWQTDNASGQIEVGFETTYGGSDGSNKVIELEANSGDVANIYKDIPTQAGEVFELSFDFSARAGHGGEDSAIEVYWDGVLIDIIIPGDNFGWENHTYKLLAQDDTARLEFKATDSNSLGGLLDNIQIDHSGFVEGSLIKLNINADINDLDSSETLVLEISDIPVGGVLSDGTGNTFAATDDESSVDISNWNLDGLTIKVPAGVDAFDLKVTSTAQENSNGDTNSNAQTISINVENAPTSSENAIAIDEDGSHTFAVSDFAFNDVDGDVLDHITITELPENGSLTLNGEPVLAGDNISADEIDGLIYTPAVNASGEDYGNFKFTVNDGLNDSAEQNFNVDVNAIADTPILTLNSSGDIPVTIRISGDHYDPNNIEDVGAGSPKFQVFVNGEAVTIDGESTFTVEVERGDWENFRFNVDAGTKIDSIDVKFINDAYDGTDDRDGDGIIGEDRNLIVDKINIGGEVNGAGDIIGGYTIEAEDAFYDKPNSDGYEVMPWAGTLSFDTSGVDVGAVAFGAEDTAIALDINAEFTDPSETHSIMISEIPEGAILSAGIDNGDGSWSLTPDQLDGLTITPPENFSGSFDIVITAKSVDGSDMASNSGTLNVSVSAVNDAPVSSDNNIVINEDGSHTFAVSDFAFSDIDGDVLDHITITELPENGSLTLNGEPVLAGDNISAYEIDGLIYTPASNASGEDYGDFKFTVNDGVSDSAEQSFNIDVSAIADAANLSLSTKLMGEDGLFDISSGGEVTIDVSYFSVDAGYNSSHGYYIADSDGNPIAGVVIEDNVKDLSENTITFNTDDYPGGVTLGFFIIPDGNTQNAELVGGDVVTFEQIDGVWTPMLNGEALKGAQAAPAYFSNTALNPDGFDHLQDSNTPGNQNWEDLYNGGDQDFTDVNTQITVTITQNSDAVVDGAAGSTMELPDIISTLNDTDGSESLSVEISAIPNGVMLSDNNGHTFTASEGNSSVDVTHWNLNNLSVQAPIGTNDFVLQVASTTTESSNGDSETATAFISIDIDGQIIQALDGAEIVQGSDGNDTLIYNADNVWSGYSAHNVETGENVSLAGYNRSTDVFDGGDGYDTIEGTSGNDALFLDDSISSFNSGSQARIQNIEEIDMGDGNDIVDMTSSKYTYDQGITVKGGAGDDVIWTSTGDDVIDGGAGNDSMFGGDGSDTLMFMANMGNDVVDGGAGGSWMDTIELSGFSGLDQGDGWTLTLNDGSSIQANDNEQGILLLSEDAAGTITFDDGGSITFENIEKITW